MLSKLAVYKKEGSSKHLQIPPISFDRAEAAKPTQANSRMMKLRTNPNDVNSPLYSLTVVTFKAGSKIEVWFKFLDACKSIFVGMNLLTATEQMDMFRALVDPPTLGIFNVKLNAASNAAAALNPANGGDTDENFAAALAAMTEYWAGPFALQRQKRYMKRYMTKDKTVTMQDYSARFDELLGYLPKFPGAIPNEGFANDEIVEIYDFYLPFKWKKHMANHGFHTFGKTKEEILLMCQQIEIGEAIDHDNVSKGGAATLEYNSKKRARFPENAVKKWCRFCTNQSHDTSECKHLLQQNEMMIRNQKQKPAYIKAKEFQARKFQKKESSNAFQAAVEAAVKKSMEAFMATNVSEKNDQADDLDMAYNNFLAESKAENGEVQEDFLDDMLDEDDEQTNDE
jgi:hypothetical protein